MKLLRSMLFVPANNWRLIQSARKAVSDAVILDLEDAVPITEKETARWFVKDAIGFLKEFSHTVVIRVNGLSTGLTEKDLEFPIQESADGIMLPKTESKQEILGLERLMEKKKKELKSKAEPMLIPLIESAMGVYNVCEIASASKRVQAIGFGAADYLRDFGRSYFELSPEENELLYARSRLVISAKIAGVLAIDTPFLGSIIDQDGLFKESRLASSLGFKGKMCIHPMHIEIMNKVFSPSIEDVDQARKIMSKYDEAKAKGFGATSFEGRMIDEATYKTAKETMEIFELIKKKKATKNAGAG